MKSEWEQVREQQIQMIREKEEQLEKLKEDLFTKLKTQTGIPEVGKTGSQPIPLKVAELSKTENAFFEKKNPGTAPKITQLEAKQKVEEEQVLSASDTGIIRGRYELERQKAAFQDERQKFFDELTRQQEKFKKMQESLEAKAKKLQEEREDFEKEKNKASSPAV
jgi:hypothetical protein